MTFASSFVIARPAMRAGAIQLNLFASWLPLP